MAGSVYLVGAGPGASDLLTLRGLSALQKADVIIVDSLLPFDYLQQLPLSLDSKQVVRLGSGEARWSQERINQEVINHARAGRTVARLKGGDPGVFGRLAEALAAIRQAGIDVEAIPGPSVATAAATASGVPMTVRERGRSFAAVTARAKGGSVVPELPQADTLAIYMGLEAAPAIRERLLAQAWSPETPVRVVERATMAFESLHHCTIDDLPACVSENAVSSPALLVVGAGASVAATDRSPVILYTGNLPGPYRTMGHLLHWPILRPRGAAGLSLVSHVGEVSSELPARLPSADVLLFDGPEEVRPFLDFYGGNSFPPNIWCVHRESLEMALGLGLDAMLLEEARREAKEAGVQSCLRNGYSRSTSKSKA
jgi:uroporphyrin-III C-methyltransferase